MTVTLDDKEYPIKLGTLAFSVLEEKTGIENPFSLLSDGKKLRSAKHLQALLYGAIKCGCIIEKIPLEISYDEVGAYMVPHRIDEYLMAVMKTLDLPSEEEIENKKKVRAAK